jgi:hypothetical protein
MGEMRYLTNDGKKCAVGKHMKEGTWQFFGGDVTGLFNLYKPEQVLTEEALEQNLSLEVWQIMQNYHDDLSKSIAISTISPRTIDYSVEELEKQTGFLFPELYFEEQLQN